jgi:hypothetical protein
MTVEIHKRGAHVPIWGILKEDGVLASPSVSCTVTVTDPEEALVAEDEVMTESETGIYYYQLPTDSDFELGWYTYVITSIDGSPPITSMQTGGFRLEA